MATALMILANGFEEIEATSVLDIVRRAGIELTVAGLSETIESKGGLKVIPDTMLNQVSGSFDLVILPGGEPGTTNLENNEQVTTILKTQQQAGKWIAAICAAPRILDKLGILDGKNATSHGSNQPKMTRCNYQEAEVVVDGMIITSRGPGTAMAFAYTIVEKLRSGEVSQQLQKAMVYRT